MQNLPPEILEELDERSLALIESANEAIKTAAANAMSHDEDTGDIKKDDTEASGCQNNVLSDVDYEAALKSIRQSSKRCKWQNMTMDEFKYNISTADMIQTNFTASELKMILNQYGQKAPNGPKARLVAAVSKLFGDGTCPVANAKSLKQIANSISASGKRHQRILFMQQIYVKQCTRNG